jgi:hypothetical protein
VKIGFGPNLTNVIFHDKDEPKKQYAINFWFKPEGNDLKLMDMGAGSWTIGFSRFRYRGWR